MKRTKKNEKAAVKAFVHSGNFTEFCKTCKAMGIVQRGMIYNIIRYYYTDRTVLKRTGKRTHVWCFSVLQTDLNTKKTFCKESPVNFLGQMRKNRNAGTYKKVLIVGHRHIYWASPTYGHADYNKSIWRDNTPVNRRKMELINRFLNK